MPNYRRNFVPGGTFFFTVTLLERKRDLLVAQIDLLRDAVQRAEPALPGQYREIRRKGGQQKAVAHPPLPGYAKKS